MKVTKIAAALALSLVALTSHAGDGLPPKSQGKKLSQMTDQEYKVVSLMARCSVAYDKFSGHMTKNPELRKITADTSRAAKDMLNMFMSDPLEAQGMIKWNQEKITDKTLPGVMEECAYVFSNLGKK